MVTVLAGCTPQGAGVTTEDLKNSESFWQANVVYWFSLALDTFANWFNGEYGLAVLVMVLIVRTLILPLTMKQVRSSKAMQAIQPQLKEIQAKYKDTPEKVQQETMKLFQENKVNPMAGCLPLIIQMPIYIALYNSIYGNSSLRTHDFLWLQLGSPDHLFILPVLAAITTFIQTWMMMRMNPAQQIGPMQFMLWVYPILIFVMSYQFPSALPLYWFYSNIYTIVQNYFLYRNNDKIVAEVNVKQSSSSKSGAKRKTVARRPSLGRVERGQKSEMTTVITSGKTVEDAVNQGLAKLGVSRDKVEIQVLEQPSKGFLGLFGAKAAKVEMKLLPVPEAVPQPIKPTTPEPEIEALLEGVAVHNPYEEAAAFLKEVAAGMGLDVEVHIKKQRDGHIFNISGEDLGMIIGRRGQTLDALQYLTNIVANRYSESFVRIVLDAENFRQRRRKSA